MGTEFFRGTRFNDESTARIEQCNDIIDDYLGQGLRLTLRQLYYQLVSRNLITNEERSYKNLSSLVSKARLAGLMDWDAIEDRIRQPVTVQEFENLGELAEVAVSAYRLPRWRDQDSYVELWVEKDALAGVLRPLAREYHVTMLVNRGYSSQSAMYESANRFKEHSDKSGVLLYLGDHDPSGEDMVRDIQSRLDMFEAEVEVVKIALTMKQIEQYDPPPNPAKRSDPRARQYIAQHGGSSWEVDALPPNVLNGIIRTALDAVVDRDLMDAVIERENEDKDKLLEAVQDLLKPSPPKKGRKR